MKVSLKDDLIENIFSLEDKGKGWEGIEPEEFNMEFFQNSGIGV